MILRVLCVAAALVTACGPYERPRLPATPPVTVAIAPFAGDAELQPHLASVLSDWHGVTVLGPSTVARSMQVLGIRDIPYYAELGDERDEIVAAVKQGCRIARHMNVHAAIVGHPDHEEVSVIHRCAETRGLFNPISPHRADECVRYSDKIESASAIYGARLLVVFGSDCGVIILDLQGEATATTTDGLRAAAQREFDDRVRVTVPDALRRTTPFRHYYEGRQ